MGRPQQPLEHRLLLTATFCLLAGGAVMVYSASSARTLLQGQGDGTMYLMKYLAYGGVGLVGMHIISRLDLNLVRRYTSILLGAAFVMLVLVKVPGIGVRVNGARRWLGAGPLQFQPSEIMKLALVLHTAAVISARPKIARNLRTLVGPVHRRRCGGDPVDRGAAGPRDRPGDLLHARDDADRGRAADAPARPGGRRRRGAGVAVRALRAVPPRAPDRVHGPVGSRLRGGVPGGAGADRDRLGRPVRARPRRLDPEDLLRPRGPHGLHPRGDRGGARAGGHPGAAVSVRHHRVRRTADRQEGDRRLRQAARLRTHLSDPVPSPAQRLRRARPRAADRRPAAVHLERLDVADRAAGGDGAVAQRRFGRPRPLAQCCPSTLQGRT